MTTGMQNQKAAVQCGQWLLYRYHPDRGLKGENPLQLDSGPPKTKVEEYLDLEGRFQMLVRSDPDRARQLFAEVQRQVTSRWQHFHQLAAVGNEAQKPE
jgi:pyruvate-ferredoxin/flavodoxin oxidoreductase